VNADRRRVRRRGVFAPGMRNIGITAAITVLAAGAALVGIYVLIDNLVPAGARSSSRTLDVLKVAIAVAAIIGAVLTGVYAYRKQKLAEADALRADADHLLTRFGKASDQLGHDNPAVRLAGVYAMAALADDWIDQRQLCINVLTAYLQVPYTADGSSPDFRPGEREVRRNLIRVIRDHLRPGFSTVSWAGCSFRFEGAIFDGGDLTGVHLSGGKVNFHAARFIGETFFLNRALIDGARVWFTRAQFEGGTVRFDGVELRSGLLDFTDAVVNGGTAAFDDFTHSGGELKPGPFVGHVPPGP
jgi:uncharacterized protein YjbI with pentapeptide repeats